MIRTTEYGTALCPMPVAAVDRTAMWAWEAGADPSGLCPDPKAVIGVCGEELSAVCSREGTVGVNGEHDDYYGTWKVECTNGHVLFVQAVDDGDDLAHLPYDPALTAQALALLGVLVDGEPS